MAHNKHTESLSNQDLNLMMPNRQAWLDLAGDWVDPFPAPELVDHNGFKVSKRGFNGIWFKMQIWRYSSTNMS